MVRDYGTKDLQQISNAIQKANAMCAQFDKISVSISGGADSDIMLDLLLKACPKEKLDFVFFDTGIEYQATKQHLDYLEKHYDIKIDRQRACKPVPLGCKLYGLPFFSKFVSEMIGVLQSKNFDFAKDGNKSFKELNDLYPNTRKALKWWCNEWDDRKDGVKSNFNIYKIPYLKEFLIENPPKFKISNKCCKGAKKDTDKYYIKDNPHDLKCVGLRKAEGGIRASAYKSCFDYNPKSEIQFFRPIWWFNDIDKQIYENLYGVVHSDCYTKYGMKRTGCAGCPFGSRFQEELKIIEQHEPKLYKAINNIFGESYEYTKKYREFKERMKRQNKKGQISIFDLMEE